MMDWLTSVREGAALWLSLEVVRATVLLTVALTAAVALRRASAATRHLLWCAALVSLLALPALSAVMPWRWSPLPGAPAAVQTSAADQIAPVEFEQRSAVRSSVSGEVGSAQMTQRSTARSSFALRPVHALAFALGIWALGALFSLGRLAFGGLVLRRLVRHARALDDVSWRTPLYEAADRLELASAPRLVLSERMPMPFVTGVLRPTIVLPGAAADWSVERRRAVLLHELAHVRRRDLLLNTLAHVACALWWFHPLARMAARRLRAESERACDDLVLRLGTLPSAYADHLLQIVRDAGRVAAPVAALPMAQRREFEGRMLAILEADARRDPPRRRHAAFAAAAFLSLVVPLAGLGPVSAEQRPPAQPQTVQFDESEARPDAQARAEAEEPAGEQAAPVAPPEQAAQPAPAMPAVAIDAVQDTGVVGALRAALRDASGEVRAEAAWALGSMHATTAGPDLVALLGRDTHPEARKMAVWSLVELDHTAGADAIATAARSDDAAEVREMAIWALGQLGQAGSQSTIVAALGDEDAEVRSIAAWALGQLNLDDAPAALISALEDGDGEVREHAAWALGQIGDADALSALTRVIGDDSAGEVALWAIGNIGGDSARPALMEALRNGNDEVRAAAARALAGRGSHPWPWPWPRPMVRD